MPYKEKAIDKLYYTISEIAEELNESTSLVRFWAGKFPEFIKPARNKKGNRLFTAQDLANFKIIYYLVKEQGMTLEGAYKRMKDNLTGEDKRIEVISKLNAIKERLKSVANSLVVTDIDTDTYGE